jgi:hypothetical protein
VFGFRDDLLEKALLAVNEAVLLDLDEVAPRGLEAVLLPVNEGGLTTREHPTTSFSEVQGMRDERSRLREAALEQRQDRSQDRHVPLLGRLAKLVGQPLHGAEFLMYGPRISELEQRKRPVEAALDLPLPVSDLVRESDDLVDDR